MNQSVWFKSTAGSFGHFQLGIAAENPSSTRLQTPGVHWGAFRSFHTEWTFHWAVKSRAHTNDCCQRKWIKMVHPGKINMEPRNHPFSMSIFQGCSLFRSETPPGISVRMSRRQLELLTFSCFEDFHPFCLKKPTALRRLKKSSPNMFHHGSTTDWSLEVSKHIALQELDLMIRPCFFAYLSTQNSVYF